LEEAQIGELKPVEGRETSYGEVLRWVLKHREGELAVAIHDDRTMPGMVLELAGPEAVMKLVGPHVHACFELAGSDEVVAAAKAEHEATPNMLLMAAWVSAEDAPALVELLQSASTHSDPEVRKAVVKATAVQATPKLRKLAEKMARAEKNKKLAGQMRTMLAAWPR
jgi:hypothetical protein